MPNFNDLDMKDWKESEILTDSLWVIPERQKSGKHDNFYHGNFIPQIPHQFILRYTKKGGVVFDPFLGSGTTAYEAEALNRNFIGIDIQAELVEHVQGKLDSDGKNFSHCICGDSTNPKTFETVKKLLANHQKDSVDLAILHPPYADIVKFSDLDEDLSNCDTITTFIEKFSSVVSNTMEILKKDGYLVVVIGDKYTSGRWVPLGFQCLGAVEELGLTLKSIVVKNMEGNRGKRNQQGIWRYRALSSDYYIFKHEYILIFKR